jgi:hypothetical protein
MSREGERLKKRRSAASGGRPRGLFENALEEEREPNTTPAPNEN